MRTVTFQSVLRGVADRTGIDGDPNSGGYNLTDQDAVKFTEYINTAYKISWEFYPWPDSLTVESRTAVAQKIAEDQAGETFIGEMIEIYQRDPRTDGNPGAVSYNKWQGGWWLSTANATATVFCVYRPAINYFTSTDWAVATAYVEGDTVYYGTTGECYVCTADSTGDLPTDTDFWGKIPFMASLADAVKSGAHSEVLAEDGQFSSSMLPDARMEAFLEHEVDLIEGQEGQYKAFDVAVRAVPY